MSPKKAADLAGRIALFRDNVARWGLLRALHMIVMRRLGPDLTVCFVFLRPIGRWEARDFHEGCTLRIASDEDVRQACEDPSLPLDEASAFASLQRGALCLAAFDGDRMVAYIWHAFRPAPLREDVWVHFPKPYRYGHSAFTHLDHRGLELQEYLKPLSERASRERGFAYALGLVETHNYAAQGAVGGADEGSGNRGAHRLFGRKSGDVGPRGESPKPFRPKDMGGRRVGLVGYAKLAGRTFTFRSTGARRHGVELRYRPGVPRHDPESIGEGFAGAAETVATQPGVARDARAPKSPVFQRTVHAVLRATSHLVPDGPLANRWIALPSFVAFHGRLPKRTDDPRALYRDFLNGRMIEPVTRSQREFVDKLEAKRAVGRICPELGVARVVDVLEVSRRTRRADVERFLAPHLGRRLVAKPTHASGVCVFLDRLGGDDVASLLAISVEDYYLLAGEALYRGLPRRILVEESLVDDDGNRPTDWRFACTRGVPWLGLADVHDGRTMHEHYFDVPSLALIHAPRVGTPLAPPTLEMPARIRELLAVAARLSKPFEFVRVDLYATRDATWFGELTFTPLAARERFADPTLSRWLLMRARHPEADLPLPPHLLAGPNSRSRSANRFPAQGTAAGSAP